MNNDNFDDIIKQKTGGHEAPVPADAWDNISKKEKRKVYPFFWWSLSSVLVMAILFFYMHSTKKQNNSLAANPKNQTIKSLSKPTNSNNDPGSKTNNSTTDENKIADKNNTQIQQPDNNNKKENEAGIAIHSITTQNTQLNEQHARPDLQAKEPHSAINKNEETISTYVKGKLHLYKRGAKFKSTITNGSAEEETADKTSSGITNDGNLINNNSKKSNKNDIVSIQKNDSVNYTATLIKDVAKKKETDSLVKNEEPDTASTKTNSHAKTASNAGKKIKKPALILDFSVIPYSPIQQYAQPLTITRVNNSAHSFYSANSIQTSLQSFVAFAVNIKKNISKKLMIGLGIQYSQISETINLSGQETDTTYEPIQRLQTNTTGPFLERDTIKNTTTGIRKISAGNSYRLFSVPLFVTYNLVVGKLFSAGFTGGVYFTFAQYQNSINGKLQSQYAYGTLADNAKNNPAMDIFGGIHVSFYASKKLQIFLEPNYRYNLNKYELKNTFLNKNINQAGAAVGISYSIK